MSPSATTSHRMRRCYQISIFGLQDENRHYMELSTAWLPYTGSIKIDGVEACKIPRAQLNAAFTVVPQDPVLFRNATVRKNLMSDKIMQLTDQNGNEQILEHVLSGVGLLNVVKNSGGLYAKFSTLNLSYEQLQRFSLAQGLLKYYFKRTKMALVDSVTDNASGEGLAHMRMIMKEIFELGQCSVISTVNHRSAVPDVPWLARIVRRAPNGMTQAN
ncbi:hypothetical protein VHEMI05656 [[Torrubiella] hemipterigena]|uniref:ABC transporter domain-containing protein n=1 Tax=[Torrubiella] hemipterigena TaxID=1531966 RepID=A0A0A1T4T8_9HYPO|nr:hypothetical protein VHEMI05656 [[Torrubiella] hemipterigena]